MSTVTTSKSLRRLVQVIVLTLAVAIGSLALPSPEAEARHFMATGTCSTYYQTVRIESKISAPANSYVYARVVLEHFDARGNSLGTAWYPWRYQGKTSNTWSGTFKDRVSVERTYGWANFSIVRPWVQTVTSTNGAKWDYHMSLLAYETQTGTAIGSPVNWTCLG